MEAQTPNGSSPGPRDASGSHPSDPPAFGRGISDEHHRLMVDWPCPFCPRTFKSPQALGGHQNSHRKERDARMKAYYEELYNSRRPMFSPYALPPSYRPGSVPEPAMRWPRPAHWHWIRPGPESGFMVGDGLRQVEGWDRSYMPRANDYMHVYPDQAERRLASGPCDGPGPGPPMHDQDIGATEVLKSDGLDLSLRL